MHSDDLTQTFRVTHPFHPLFDRVFAIVTRRHNWSEDRVFFYDDQHLLQSLPVVWTSLAPDDPVVLIAAGRSPFRLHDLIELTRFVRQQLAASHETEATSAS